MMSIFSDSWWSYAKYVSFPCVGGLVPLRGRAGSLGWNIWFPCVGSRLPSQGIKGAIYVIK